MCPHGFYHCDLWSALQLLLQIAEIIALALTSLQTILQLLFCKFASYIAIALAICEGALQLLS